MFSLGFIPYFVIFGANIILIILIVGKKLYELRKEKKKKEHMVIRFSRRMPPTTIRRGSIVSNHLPDLIMSSITNENENRTEENFKMVEITPQVASISVLYGYVLILKYPL